MNSIQLPLQLSGYGYWHSEYSTYEYYHINKHSNRFQLLLVYILLLRSDPNLRWEEYFIFTYVVVYGCETFRKVISVHNYISSFSSFQFIFFKERPFKNKLKKFFVSWRNGSILLAVITYILGFILRCIPDTLSVRYLPSPSRNISHFRMLGRIIIIMNSVIWPFRLVNFLSVHRKLGPYIKIATIMVRFLSIFIAKNLLFLQIPRTMTMITLLFVVMLSYGLVRQGITYPDEVSHTNILH